MGTCEYKILARELQNNINIVARDADLNHEQLSDVINKMMAQRGEDGLPRRITPNTLIVPIHLYGAVTMVFGTNNWVRMSGIIKAIIVAPNLPDNAWYLAEVPGAGGDLPSEADMVEYFATNPHMIMRLAASNAHTHATLDAIAGFSALGCGPSGLPVR